MAKAIWFGLGVLLLGATSSSAAPYKIFELIPPAGQEALSTGGYSISENGWVAGFVGNSAARWQVSAVAVQSPITRAALSPYGWSVGLGVNDHGAVVGTMNGVQAFVWWGNLSQGLQSISGCSCNGDQNGRCAVAYAINDGVDNNNVYDPMVVGLYSSAASDFAIVQPTKGFSWISSGPIQCHSGNIQTTIGSAAYAVNEHDVVAGEGEVAPPNGVAALTQAWIWNPEFWHGALPGEFGPGQATAYGINDFLNPPYIVGVSEGQAFVRKGGAPISLGVYGVARDINNYEVIVGAKSAGPGAFVKVGNGPVQDLNLLIPPGSGWILRHAYSINDNGWIVGIGERVVTDPGPGSGPGGGGADASGTMDPGGPTPSSSPTRGFLLIPE